MLPSLVLLAGSIARRALARVAQIIAHPGVAVTQELPRGVPPRSFLATRSRMANGFEVGRRRLSFLLQTSRLVCRQRIRRAAVALIDPHQPSRDDAIRQLS